MKIYRFLAVVAIMMLFSFLLINGDSLEPIKIGFVGDFSQVSQKLTEEAYRAALIAVEDINAGGGILGRPVIMIKRDGGNDPELHAKYVREIIEKEDIVAIFGGAASSCVLEASRIAKEKKIPYLVSVGNSQVIVLENGHPYVFLFEPNSAMEGRGISIFASILPWKRYAWLGPDYVWGHRMLKAFKKNLKDMNVNVQFVKELWHGLDEKNFMPYIQNLLVAKPEALFLGSWGEDIKIFILQAKSTRLFNSIAVFGMIYHDTAVALGKDLPKGVWGFSRAPFYYLSEKFPMAKTFTEKYHSKFNTYPGGFSICGYDSFLAWVAAAKKSDSVKPEKIAQTLKGLKFNSLRGESFIRPIDGQMNCSAYFGLMKFVPEYPFAIIKPVIEIKAKQTWLTEDEIKAVRRKKN